MKLRLTTPDVELIVFALYHIINDTRVLTTSQYDAATKLYDSLKSKLLKSIPKQGS